MCNLSAFVKNESDTVSRIYDYWKKRGGAEQSRGYLGASVVGHECDRYLWYGFRWCVKPEFDGRMYRLFNRGHLEEKRFVEELRGIGCIVHGDDEQVEVTAIGGHFSGHMDGVAIGVPEAPKTYHVLEFKTHSDKSFNGVKNDGVKKSKPMHYAQMQVYMGLGKLDRALYLAVNKDNDELYSERIEYSSAEFKAIMVRVERIIASVNPPERMATRRDDWRCKFCEAKDLCFGGDMVLPLPAVTCRTCCHATPEIDKGETRGRWSCAKHKKDITNQEQVEKHDCHIVLPSLILGSEVVDGSADSMKLKSANGIEFYVGRKGFSTAELIELPVVGLKAAMMVKGELCGSFAVPGLTLLEQYDPKEARLVWEGRPDRRRITGAITGTENDGKHIAFEFDDKFLYVEYIGCDYAAVWEGVE